MTSRPIGFIGLGNMGGRMSKCIVRGGAEVLGFDVKTSNIAESDATPASSVGEVVDGSDVVLLSLPDSHTVEAVMLGDDGVVAHLRSGQTVVDLTTAAPDSTRKIAAICAEKGVVFMDAGISGGADGAAAGTLTLMVGGPAEALELVRPILDYFSSNIYHLGDTGAGHLTKLLNNFLNAIALSGTAEVMVAAKKAGLPLDMVLEVFNKSSGRNFATMARFPSIVHGDYLEGGLTNTLMMKDVVLYSEAVSALGLASLNAAGPLASFGLARQLGYADRISNTVVDAIGDISGGVRLFDAQDNA